MELPMSLAWKKCSAAITLLAGAGTQRERLLSACVTELCGLKRKDFPNELHPIYEVFLCHFGPFDSQMAGHDFEKMVETMTETDIQSAIDALLQLHDAVTRYQPTPTLKVPLRRC